MTITEFLSTNTTPFGSRVWGGATDDSDYDYLMCASKQQDLINLLSELGVPHRVYPAGYSGVRCHTEFNSYQISVPFLWAYDAQLHTIKFMNRLHALHPTLLSDRRTRHGIFESTFQLLSGTSTAVPSKYSIEHFPELYV